MHSILIRVWNLKAVKYRVERTAVLTDPENTEMGAGWWMSSESKCLTGQVEEDGGGKL